MRTVADDDARKVRVWLDQRGMRFVAGPDPETDLTDGQIHEQCKMYIAAMRMANEFGCDSIGIQYQQGLKDMAPASDLVEGMLNNPDRPPVANEAGEALYAGLALPHFNEVDECAGVDALITNRVWRALGIDPSTTLHDVRWGEHYSGDGIDDFVWMFQISGAVPPRIHGRLCGGGSERQPPMYFRLGGGTVKGVGKPGEIVWSRVFMEAGALKVDMGRGSAVESAGRGNRAALGGNHAAVADDARGAARGDARSVHGAPSCEPHQRGLCAGRRGSGPCAGGESGDVR